MLSIGKLNLQSRLILAPLLGISDLPYRMINRAKGCRFAFTEMISANSLVYKSVNTMKMLSSDKKDSPLGVQLMGNDPDIMRRAVDIIYEYPFELIDLNAACPAKKVASSGKGAALMKDPALLYKLIEIIVKRAGRPVTVKIRTGWDSSSINAVEIARGAQDAGADGIFIHGRTRSQRYTGAVDYDIISKVKEAVDLPVIASGDALTPALIKKMFDETGCDGVIIARGSFGNPWLFRDAEEYLANSVIPASPDIDELTLTMRDHLRSSMEFNGEKTGVLRFRKFFRWYTRGMPLKDLKRDAYLAVGGDDMMRMIDDVHQRGIIPESGIYYHNEKLNITTG